MLDLHAASTHPRTLVEVDLQPSEEVHHKGMVAGGAIQSFQGKRNVVQLGVDDAVPVLSKWSPNEPLDEQIEAQRERWDFASVRLSCSFLPDRGCRFVWARMVAELTAPGRADAGPPVAFDLFPRGIEERQTFKRSYKVTPNLKLAFAELGANAGSEQEVIRYEPRLAVAGLLTDTPTWDFYSLDSAGLVGSRELFLLIKMPKGSVVEAKFVLAAEVETLLGRVSLRRYSDPELVNRCYVLVGSPRAPVTP
jgi:hypothetical protein